MRKQFAVALVVLSLLSSNAWALTLNEARTQGRVGKRSMAIWLHCKPMPKRRHW
jgi:uncharacterized protein YdbL (DUF1318 family)